MTKTKREISPQFVKDLKDGILSPVLKRVLEDDTLMLAIRDGYINIYYRGGSLFNISASANGPSYCLYFDVKYNKCGKNEEGLPLPLEFPFLIGKIADACDLVAAAAGLKCTMDRYFSKVKKPEREFQQLVARENNRSAIANSTHYFIVDIEIAGLLPGARYDMLAVRWLSHERGQQGALVPVLIEMKYGVDALKGDASLEKHLHDAFALKNSITNWDNVVRGLENQLRQLDELGLLTYNRSVRVNELKINRDATPELIFLLANYNPGSETLKDILENIDRSDFDQSGLNLLFFVSCFAGYGMYREFMLTLREFKAEVSRLLALAKQTRQREGTSPGKGAASNPEEITFNDCCRIILEQGAPRHEPVAPGKPDYRRDLLALLNKEFGIEWNDGDESRWDKGVPVISRSLTESYARVVDPFAGWLEYTPVKGEEEVWHTHRVGVSDAAMLMKQRFVAFFRDLLLLRWPEAAHRTTSWARLRALGLVLPARDADDFW